MCPDPQFPRVEIFEDRGEPADVVLMRVRRHHDIEPPDPPAPKIRRNDIFARVQAGAAFLCPVRQQPSAVDQHFRALGEHNQQTVALTDVDGSQFQQMKRRSVGKRLPDQQREKRYDCGERGPAQIFSLDDNRQPDQRRQKSQRQPQRRIGDAPVRLHARMPFDDASRGVQHPAGKRRNPVPARRRSRENPTGTSAPISGVTIRFEEKPENDTRWKYSAIGSASADLHDDRNHGEFVGEQHHTR